MQEHMMDGKTGRFGDYGGQYVPETMMNALQELEAAFMKIHGDKKFNRELFSLQQEFAGRPTPLTLCGNISEELGCKVYLKREDLVHGGSHKLNNTLEQGLLAKHMGKKRLIAETGAGQHGVATAIVGAVLGLPVEVYMGEIDTRRQALNVFRMKLMGAKVIPVKSGTRTLKDATSEAFRDWVATVRDTYYLIGSVVGPHPYPLMVREFQSIIGREAREQNMRKEGRLPDSIVACVGGGSNAIGIFHPFLNDDIKLIGVEPEEKASTPVNILQRSVPEKQVCCTARSRTSSRMRMARSCPPTASPRVSITRELALSTQC